MLGRNSFSGLFLSFNERWIPFLCERERTTFLGWVNDLTWRRLPYFT